MLVSHTCTHNPPTHTPHTHPTLTYTHTFDTNLKTLKTYRLASSRFAFTFFFNLETQKISSAYYFSKTVKARNGKNSSGLILLCNKL